jgi:hypothetical protein
MATLDFPTATPGGTYTGGNGVTYTYDGTAGVWTAAASGGGTSEWTLTGSNLYPNAGTTNVLIGGTLPGTPAVSLSSGASTIPFYRDSTGRVLVGTTTARANFYNGSSTALFQVEGANNSDQRFTSQVYGAASIAGPFHIFAKHRSTSVGGVTIVASGDQMGGISFTGSDGTEFVEAAQISAEVDGTPGANDMPGRLVFSTTPSGSATPVERMRIDSAGTSYFLSTANTIGALTTVGAGTSTRLYYGSHTATGIGGTISYTVWSNGNVVNTNNSYAAISDVKLKENIVDAGSQWDDIKGLRVCNYNLKEGQTHRQIGLVAQEVETISPGLVFESPDRDDEGNDLGTVTKSVNYSVLYMKAVKALQEAMERIEQLEARIEAAGI